uniref:2-oxoglutarate and iron-dependent oxygenase domain containing 1 n=1 Tax=Cyprinodon variegatus TaxID=28743 RepID=A0A3Q2CGW9_CYPVA
DLQLDCHPFPHCIIKNFLRSQTFVESLQRELLELNFNEKSNDLYKFKQSDDLKKRKEPHIAAVFRSWLGDVLGVELEPTVDISCAKYEYTVLLCHDDELEGRRVAFILYLVPPWQSSDGGTLDLYSTDRIVKSLVPSWNTLVLFEVSPVSFHQVSEVLSRDKCRLSLSGWFHGPSLERPPRFKEPSIVKHPHLPRDEKFREVREALRQSRIEWMKRGPANKCYESASLDSLPECVNECWELLRSEAFFLLLSNFTGLHLHYLCPADEEDEETEKKHDNEEEEVAGTSAESSTAGASNGGKLSTPVCCGEVRRWSHGSYTLLHDAEAAQAEYALDLILPFGCTWETEFGGSTCYVANEEDEELLTVYPEENSLALVYRDKETLKFVKHVNHRSSHVDGSTCREFYDFSFVY